VLEVVLVVGCGLGPGRPDLAKKHSLLWAVFYYKIGTNLWATIFSMVKVMHYIIWKRMDLATFWVIFSQAHLVTLTWTLNA
jgi:hypothetical protein